MLRLCYGWSRGEHGDGRGGRRKLSSCCKREMVDTNFAAAAPPSQSSTVYDPARRKIGLGLRRAPIQPYQPLILWWNTRKTWWALLHQSTCAANVRTKSARHYTLWGGYADDPGTDGARHWEKWRGDLHLGPRQQVSAPVRKRMANLVPVATPKGSSIRVPIGRLWLEAPFSRAKRGFRSSGRETPDLRGSFGVPSGVSTVMKRNPICEVAYFFWGPQWCPTELPPRRTIVHQYHSWRC